MQLERNASNISDDYSQDTTEKTNVSEHTLEFDQLNLYTSAETLIVHANEDLEILKQRYDVLRFTDIHAEEKQQSSVLLRIQEKSS